jgi:hypothetical protein
MLRNPVRASGRYLSDEQASNMNDDRRELNGGELSAVTGGGIVDKILLESEATTDDFLKRFAESNLRFINFINTPSGQALDRRRVRSNAFSPTSVPGKDPPA